MQHSINSKLFSKNGVPIYKIDTHVFLDGLTSKFMLFSQVDQMVQCFEKRKEYISAFLSLYGRSVYNIIILT